MNSYRYAAYGSNLHPLRLQSRVDSAVLLGTGHLPDHSLKFHKRSSTDGSGKCNVSAGGPGVLVAVYELAERDRPVLDKIEGTGNGYDSHEIEIDGFGTCSMYIATADAIDEAVHPFDWYRAYVLHGAQYHGFAADYVARLEKQHIVQDTDSDRAAPEWAQIEKIRLSIASHSTRLRIAAPDEAAHLSDLALRSKAYWGYPDDFLAACKDELTYLPEQILSDSFDFVVAEAGNSVAGFYALHALPQQEIELAALFVEPAFIGKGIGRALMQHAIARVRNRNALTLLIQGDPNAEHFYLAAGATKTGVRESESIAGRFLPLFEIRISSLLKQSD